jgi:RNA polymerase sigma-70 factor (ECF subfamily)
LLLEETQAGLVDACRRGEQEALRALFDIYKDRLYTIAVRYSGDAAAAEDIVQDTFLKLPAALGKFRGDGSFESWLYRLVVNACFDHRRRARRFLPAVESLLDFVRGPAKTPLEDVLETERSASVRDAIARLDPEHRIVVVLRYSMGLPYEEIAQILGCPKGTVASRLNRAHALLEKRLRGRMGKETSYV